MQIHSDSFENGADIPAEFAFGKRGTGEERIALAGNRNPHLAWSDAPAATKSFALACIDGDAPSKGDDVNKEGCTVPADLPRVEFAHWLMVDVPHTCMSIAAGTCSDGITAHGKRNPPGPPGSRQGRNDYTGWFASDPEMAGEYFGYDGPCPPWNDALRHRYRFRVYALDVPRLDLPEEFGWPELRAALRGHVLGEAEWLGIYSINPGAER